MKLSSIHSFLVITLMTIITQAHTTDAFGAQDWSWPDDPKNLQVLSDTISTEMLARTMRGFTGALGVRCSHCHAGERGRGLAGLDFPSDEKRAKRVARDMLNMVRSINQDVIATLDEPSGAEVTCFSCHRGQPVPPEALHAILLDIETEDGAGAALARYDELRDAHFGEGVYNFGPRTFTRVADRLIDEGKNEAAMVILERGIGDYPDNYSMRFYAYRATLAIGDTVLARLHLEDAIKLNPGAGFLRSHMNEISPD